MDNRFGDFLVEYTSDGCTVNLPAIEELTALTEDYVSQIDPFFCFTSVGVEDYVDYLRRHMTDDYKHFFVLQFNERRYTRFLELWIQQLIRDQLLNES